MSSRLVGLRNGLVIAACLSLSLVGCVPPPSGLPGSVSILLPDGTNVEAEQGSGAASLANTQWQFFRTIGSAEALVVTVNFGPGGELGSFTENTIAQNIFGNTIQFDGQRHPTAQQGLEYAAATYGAETGDAGGFAFESRLTAFFAGIQAGNGTASATATFDAGDPDTVSGTFTDSTRVTIASIPGGDSDDSFPFVGRRVTD